MRNLMIAAIICTAQPALAFDRMLLGDCQASFEQLSNLIAPDDDKTSARLRSIDATFDGWCKIDGGDPGFEGAEFDTFIWRTDDTSRWTIDSIPPMGLQLRITGLDPDTMQNSAPTNRPLVTVEATIRQDPDAGQVIVERIEMSNDAGDSMTVSAVFERVFLSSPSMMQVSAGAAVFKAGLMSMTLDGTYENPFGAKFSVSIDGDEQTQQQEIFDIISKLPEGVIDDASRAELMAFADDVPRPVGTLDMVVGSERGFGLMQVGMAMYRSLETAFADGNGPELDVLMDGLTISSDWTPSDGHAD